MLRWLAVGVTLAGAQLAALAVTAPAPPAAEDQRARPSGITEGVLVTRVRWPVRVVEVKETDAALCRNLAPADFQVLEDGKPARVTAADSDAGATLFVVLIDASETMTESLDAVRKGALKLASRLAARDQVMVASFAESVTVQAPPTRDLGDIERGIRAVQPTFRLTALYDALDQVTEELQPLRARKAIIVITDGEDTASRTRDVQKILDRMAHSRDLRLCTVLYANRDDMSVNGPLRILTQASAGRFEWVPSGRRPSQGAEAISGAFGAIADWFDREVVLTYEPPALTLPPKKGKAAGAPQRVRVKVQLRDGLPCRLKQLLTERLIFPAASSKKANQPPANP